MNKFRSILVLLVMVSLAGGAYFYLQNQDHVATSEKQVTSAMDFQLPDALGAVHSLSEVKDQWILLHYWASWCAPCTEEIPHLVSFASKLEANESIRVVAVSLDDGWENANRVLPSKGLPPKMISLIDLSQSTAKSMGTYKLPETFLLSPDRKVITKWAGSQKWDDFLLKAIRGKVH